MAEPPEGYRVGRNKPPYETRFATGVSGNLKGRPRKPKSTGNPVADVFNEKIKTTRKDGRVARMTRTEFVVEALTVQAVAGKPGAARAWLEYHKYFVGSPGPTPSEDLHDYRAEVRRKIEEMSVRQAEERAAREAADKNAEKPDEMIKVVETDGL